MKFTQEEIDFYNHQVSLMEQRYEILFTKNKLSWFKYYKYVKYNLKNNLYWIWTFLCGLENFVKANNFEIKNKIELKNNLYNDAKSRIYRIIGDSNKIDEYINSLPKKERNEIF